MHGRSRCAIERSRRVRFYAMAPRSDAAMSDQRRAVGRWDCNVECRAKALGVSSEQARQADAIGKERSMSQSSNRKQMPSPPGAGGMVKPSADSERAAAIRREGEG